uniref:Uncharacterized protein n=1 Tax=Leersia perrieri TaxID=77586 RepID=A0A0D9WLF7_9ORYZ
MERIIAMSVVGAGPGNVFGPGMSAGALETFVPPRRQQSAANKAPAPAEDGSARPAAKEEGAAAAAAKGKGGGGGGARFDPAMDGFYCFETVSPH